jgi:hypothetical protein
MDTASDRGVPGVLDIVRYDEDKGRESGPMPSPLKPMCVSIARYASERTETYLLTATRGERGRYGNLPQKPTIERAPPPAGSGLLI